MKHIVEFNLPEDKPELELHMLSGRLHSALFEFSEWLRRKYKHCEPPSPAAHVEHSDICDKFYEVMNEHDVKLDGL